MCNDETAYMQRSPCTPESDSKTAIARTIGMAISLWVMFAGLRAYILNIEFSNLSEFGSAILDSFGASYLDFLVVLPTTAAAVAGVHLLRSRPLAQRIVSVAYALFALVTAVWGLSNVRAVAMLGGPFTYEWLQYSEFLRSEDALNALRVELTAETAVLAACVLAAFFAASRVIGRAIRILLRRMPGGVLAAVAVLAAPPYLLLAMSHVKASGWPEPKLANPGVAFFRSALFEHTPMLFTMPTNVGPEDFWSVAERPPESSALSEKSANFVRNVVLFVMESVPAELVETYGGEYAVTPVLQKLRPITMQFQNIYTHAPATNYSLVSLLTSIYPNLSYRSMTEEHSDIALPSIASELRLRGLRTGFFSSADARFQSLDKFLEHRGFDLIQDYRERKCKHPTFEVSTDQWKNLDCSSDLCTVDSVIDWIGSDRERPFFAVVMTAMTHYPYFTLGNDARFTENAPLNRYLNALRTGDQALGELIRYIWEEGLADSTLVVVVADHGEAFGQHGYVGHASAIYEENVHVPLLLLHPKLFSGETSSTLGGLIDIGPTILDAMNLPLPGQWQGRSLFSQSRSKRAYFFSPWRGLLFGYREGNQKMIFDASTGKSEVYDLSRDPHERVNIARSPSSLLTDAPNRLAAWVQYQAEMVNRLTGIRDASE